MVVEEEEEVLGELTPYHPTYMEDYLCSKR